MKYSIRAKDDCKVCRGAGSYWETMDPQVPGSQQQFDCDCIGVQYPDNFNEETDEVEALPSLEWERRETEYIAMQVREMEAAEIAGDETVQFYDEVGGFEFDDDCNCSTCRKLRGEP